MSDDPVDELLEEDQYDTEVIEEDVEIPVGYNTVSEYITQLTETPIFYFEVAGSQATGIPFADAGIERKRFSIKEIMEDPRFSFFLLPGFISRYEKIINFETVNAEKDIVELFTDLNNHFTEEKQISTDQNQGFFDKRYQGINEPEEFTITFDKKRTNDTSAFMAQIYGVDAGDTSGSNFQDVITLIETTNMDEIIEQEKQVDAETKQQEEDEAMLDTAQQVVNNAQSYSTSGVAWGITTTQEGYVLTPGTDTYEVAPFIKGDEYRDFIDMSEAEIFELQKQMVQAGMAAPTIDEYGQWTAREANFMVGIMVKATDTGTWAKDRENKVPMWTTALANQVIKYKEAEDFTNLLKADGYGVPKPNPTTAEIKSLLDTAAAANGVVLSEADYVNFANVVLKAMSTSAQSQIDNENAAVTDRDLIFNTNFGDPRSVKEGEYSRYLEGSDLPLILPSYEFLTQQAGYQPPVLSTEEILNDEIKKLKSRQIKGNQDLAAIKYTTNMFETAMGKLTYGGAEKEA